MRGAWIVTLAVVLALGCGKEKAPATTVKPRAAGARAAEPSRAAELERLWSYAPPGAELGIVVTGEALLVAERAIVHLEPLRALNLSTVVDTVIGMRAALQGSAANLAAAGVDLRRGGALFAVYDPAQVVVVLPVVDAEKFRAAQAGTRDGAGDRIGPYRCIHQRDVYACSTNPTVAFAGGDLGALARKHAGAGNAQLVLAAKQPFGFDDIVSLDGPITASADLRPGELTLRVRTPGRIAPPFDALVASPPAALDPGGAAGFVVAPFGVLATAAAPTPLVTGVDLATLLRSLAGPLTVVVAPGATEVVGRVRLRDRAPATTLVGRCTELARWIGVEKPRMDTCRVGPFQGLGYTADMWVEGDELRLGGRGYAPRAPARPLVTPLGRELAGYTIAAWGRGIDLHKRLPALTEIGVGARFDDRGIELLVGVRTIHANPAPVVAKLEAAVARGGDVTAIAAIAKAHPKTPIADDVAAGSFAFELSFIAIGMVFAVVVPGVLEYMKQKKSDEAMRWVNELARTAKLHHVTHGRFPAGKTAWTPKRSCCTYPDRRCPVDLAAWEKDPIWRALGFKVTEPDRYQYWYKGTAKQFDARVVADLDCDNAGTTEFRITGRVQSGGPVVDIAISDQAD